ncbi:ABC transporter substrate-binding protein [Maridesulfovibrio frigidus]|uniref:ABC transporter substrate-binding protein n=1 Tax=Maridesulfovibrio frigidus TaxID=340956 RepID=UPI0004E0ED15|nr:ABC transporter substrate-binding protein [Maridesulfovibrio frigidus]
MIKNMQKLMVMFFLIAMMGFAACGDPEPIKIGVVGELSGRRSEIGVGARNAVQLYVDQVNEAGGIRGRLIELVIRDNTGDPEICRQVLDSMIADGLKFIIGPVFSQMAEVTLEAIEGKDVLVLTGTMSTDLLVGRDDNLLRVCSTSSRQASLLAKTVVGEGIKSMAVVYDLSNRKYTEQVYKLFKRDVEKHGVLVPLALTIEKTKHPEMLALARKIVDADVGGVLMCLSAIDAANLAQQIRKLDSDIPFFGVSWSQSNDLLPHGGRAVEGMVLSSTQFYGQPSAAMVAYRKQYFSRYKQAPSFVSDLLWDGTSLMLMGIERSEELTPEGVKKAILSIEGFQGLSQPVRFDKFGDVLDGYYLVKVQDGKFVVAD